MNLLALSLSLLSLMFLCIGLAFLISAYSHYHKDDDDDLRR